MTAVLKLKERHVLSDHCFAEIKIWEVAPPVRGSWHTFKYSLVLIESSKCVLRFDNEASKGDHKHFDDHETAYIFSTLDRLLQDFWNEVDQWLK